MKKLVSIVGWIVELIILAGLLFKHLGFYDLTVAKILVLFSPVIAGAHWAALKRECLTKKGRLILFLLTGPCVLLAMSLILNINYELKKVAILGGGPSKEMIEISNESLRSKFIPQWNEGTVERIRSERLIYAMLLASLCVLYGTRYSASRTQDVEKINLGDKDPPSSKSETTE